MKIVGLVAFRDEAPYIPYLIASLAPLVDEIVALDDRSTDAGPDLLHDAGAKVLSAPLDATFGRRRSVLLEAGRSAGGTHFVSVDADETFSESFVQSGRELIERLGTGEALKMPFRTFWKGPERYRIGREYDLPLACIFRDDGTSMHPDVTIHEARLPGRVGWNARVVEPAAGEMFHLQFAAWHRSQIKQGWYRCKEFLDGVSPIRVNARYVTTLDGPLVRTRVVDPACVSHLPQIGPLAALPPSWHLDEVLAWLDQHGPTAFEPLQIWHVPEFARAFMSTVGRPPRAPRYGPHAARFVGDLFGSARAAARRIEMAADRQSAN